MNISKPILIHPNVGVNGMNELHYAAYCGDIEMLQVAIEKFDVNATDDNGYTALHWLCEMAATSGPRVEMLKIIVDHKANLEIKDNDGNTPISLALSAGSSEGDKLALEIFKLKPDNLSEFLRYSSFIIFPRFDVSNEKYVLEAYEKDTANLAWSNVVSEFPIVKFEIEVGPQLIITENGKTFHKNGDMIVVTDEKENIIKLNPDDGSIYQ